MPSTSRFTIQLTTYSGAVVSGAVIRKGRPLFFLVFIFIWSTLVYDPIARSSWNPVGWSNYWKGHGGVFDFAGGTVVHVRSLTILKEADFCVRSVHPRLNLLTRKFIDCFCYHRGGLFDILQMETPNLPPRTTSVQCRQSSAQQR